MASDNREQQFERALARLLRDASPESHCPDAEVLSAYHERTLPPEEMARWKEHISACVPCQEVLTLVERSENVQAQEWDREPVAAFEAAPLSSARSVSSRSHEQLTDRESQTSATAPVRVMRVRPRWRWLAPVGALAAALIAWVGVHEIRTQKQQTASVQMARTQSPPPPLVAPSAVPAERTDITRKKDEVSTPSLDQSRREPPEIAKAVPSPAPVAPESAYDLKTAPPPPRVPERTLAKSIAEIENERKGAGESQAAAPPSQAVDALQNRGVQQNAQNYPLGGAMAGAPAPQKKQKTEVPASSQSAAVETAAPLLQTDQVAARTSSQMNLLAAAAADHRYIVAPGEKSAWRVGDGGRIDRSTDHGRTWKLENSGVTVDLTAGSAISDRVCWVVGKSGTILLSTDGGRHWKQLTSPIENDLGGIHAIDALHASVWDVPNRNSFETHDGGVTWIRSGNE